MVLVSLCCYMNSKTVIFLHQEYVLVSLCCYVLKGMVRANDKVRFSFFVLLPVYNCDVGRIGIVLVSLCCYSATSEVMNRARTF